MTRSTLILMLFLLPVGIQLSGQTINIHAVSTLRKVNIDAGYTLDGDHMAASRMKLLNPSNFSDTGTYPKRVSIYSGYYTSGSLEAITNTTGVDLFFFGSFIKETDGLIPFTDAEIDSLYAWSLRGGKVIIAEQSGPNSDGRGNLGNRWGFENVYQAMTSVNPTEFTKDYSIFNGPFGTVSHADFGGSSQGFLRGNPETISVLGVDQYGKITLMMDCISRDLIIADVDAYTDLGGLSQGDEILNQQDAFWANTIAFMDSIDQEFPSAEISYDGNQLSTGNYYWYRWLNGFEPIDDSDTSRITPATEGYYRVLVKDNIGCSDTSGYIEIGNPQLPAIQCRDDIQTFTDPGMDYTTLVLPKPRAYDPDGIASVINDAGNQFYYGTTTVNWIITDSAGNSSYCTQYVTVDDKEFPKVEHMSSMHVDTDPGKDYATLSLEPPSATDNVGIASVTNNAPDFFKVGTVLIKWYVTDLAGNTTTVSQYIYIADNEDPVISCPQDTLVKVRKGTVSVKINIKEPLATDNVEVVSISNNAPETYTPGVTIVNWTAADRFGNTSSCSQLITVEEVLSGNPSLPGDQMICPNVITPNDDGLNDVFRVINLPEDTELTIFDRSETIVYQTMNYQNDWNGRDQSGLRLPGATYWYVLSTTSGKKFTGFVVVKFN